MGIRLVILTELVGYDLKRMWDRCVLPLVMVLILSVGSLFVYGGGEARQARAVSAPAAGQRVELPIVMYHHILKEQARLNKYTISPEEFRQDMQYLKDNGYTPISMAELIAWANEGAALPEKPAMITFDDGYESFYEYAYPILQEFGFRAVFSVVGKYADQYSEIDDHHVRYSHCTWEQLAEMHKSGLVEIENHSYNLHVNQDGRHGSKKKRGESDEAYRKLLTEDLSRLQEECYEYFGVYPTTFTYPFGQISDEALPILKDMGFQAALTCQEKLNHLTGAPEELYRLNRFNRPHESSLEVLLSKAHAQEQKSVQKK